MTRAPCICGCGRIPVDYRAKYVKGHRPVSLETREKLAAGKRGALHPSRKHPELYADLARGAREHCRKGYSRLEDGIAPFLLPKGFEARRRAVGRFTADFYNPETKTAVEVNGCWYHACEHCRLAASLYPTQLQVREKDKRKRAAYAGAGIRLVEIWEHEIRDVDAAVEKILIAVTPVQGAPDEHAPGR